MYTYQTQTIILLKINYNIHLSSSLRIQLSNKWLNEWKYSHNYKKHTCKFWQQNCCGINITTVFNCISIFKWICQHHVCSTSTRHKNVVKRLLSNLWSQTVIMPHKCAEVIIKHSGATFQSIFLTTGAENCQDGAFTSFNSIFYRVLSQFVHIISIQQDIQHAFVLAIVWNKCMVFKVPGIYFKQPCVSKFSFCTFKHS